MFTFLFITSSLQPYKLPISFFFLNPPFVDYRRPLPSNLSSSDGLKLSGYILHCLLSSSI